MVLLARSTASAHSGEAVGEAATLLVVAPEELVRSLTASLCLAQTLVISYAYRVQQRAPRDS